MRAYRATSSSVSEGVSASSADAKSAGSTATKMSGAFSSSASFASVRPKRSSTARFAARIHASAQSA